MNAYDLIAVPTAETLLGQSHHTIPWDSPRDPRGDLRDPMGPPQGSGTPWDPPGTPGEPQGDLRDPMGLPPEDPREDLRDPMGPPRGPPGTPGKDILTSSGG